MMFKEPLATVADDLGETLGAIYAKSFWRRETRHGSYQLSTEPMQSRLLYTGFCARGMCWSPPLVPLMIPCKASFGITGDGKVLSKEFQDHHLPPGGFDPGKHPDLPGIAQAVRTLQ